MDRMQKDEDLIPISAIIKFKYSVSKRMADSQEVQELYMDMYKSLINFHQDLKVFTMCALNIEAGLLK